MTEREITSNGGLLAGAKLLVVGASSGIGAGFARAAAENGAQVVVSARRVEQLELLASEINEAAVPTDDGNERGVIAYAVPGDTTIPEEAARVARTAAELMGGLDLMVYVAGYGVLQRISEVDPDTWQGVFGVNVIGANVAAGAALREMDDDGIIAFVSSRTVIDASAMFGSYSSTKAALEQSIKTWRVEYPQRRFVRIVMGNTQPSEFHEHMGLDLMTEAILRWGDQALPSGMMHTREVGSAMAESLGVMLRHRGIDSSELQFDARRAPLEDR